jgi:ABC-2 type transport system ATP-binding protein
MTMLSTTRDPVPDHTDPAVAAVGLGKSFGGKPAVRDLDLTVPRGGVYGLLGPNGAGKTTVIRMLATLQQPDAGRASVFGHDTVRGAAAIRRRISLTGQFSSIDEELTGRENLVVQARLLGHGRAEARARAEELLEAFELTEAADRQTRTYSGGMRRRLDLAAGLVRTPDLLFLDEPTTGLDPRSRMQVWDIVRALVADGATVLLTTQYLEEADQLADRIAVLEHGTLIATGTPDQLKRSAGASVLQLTLADPGERPAAAEALERQFGAPVQVDGAPAGLTAPLPPDDAAEGSSHLVLRALSALDRSGVAVTAFELRQPTLDEVFLALTGRPAATTHEPSTTEGDIA